MGDRPPINSFVPSTTIELANFYAILLKLDALLILLLGTGNDLDSVFLSINDLFLESLRFLWIYLELLYIKQMSLIK